MSLGRERPTGEYITDDRLSDWRIMEELKVGMRFSEPPIGSYSAQRAELYYRFEEMSYELRTYMLADHLGDKRVTETRTEEHECIRFASWWDHFKATYRGRWWMSWRRWDVGYNIEHHPLTATAVVDLTRYWVFPRADVPVPELGDPVRFMQSSKVQQEYQPQSPSWSKRQDGGEQERRAHGTDQ